MLLLRQIQTLTWKNILIALIRHPVSTPLRALLLPVIFAWFLAFARNLFIPPSVYGIGDSHPLKPLEDALNIVGGGRKTLAIVNNGFTGGAVDNLTHKIAQIASASGKDVQILRDEVDLLNTCRSSLRGASSCIAGLVFYSSPTEGPGGIWNYTLRADGALGLKIDVRSTGNDQDIYVLPLQHAVDAAIASNNLAAGQNNISDQVFEYPFTSLNQKERADKIRVTFMRAIINYLSVAFLITMCGITYHLTGMMASERENRLSQLIECMMPNIRRWEPQLVRLSSYHFAFSLIYLPGWVAIGIILSLAVFTKTSIGIVLIFHVLTGLSLSSFSIFGAAFFQKSQLSGVIVTISSLLLAVIAQFVDQSTAAVTILGFLFPPMNYTYFIILMARFERKNVPTNLLKAGPESPWSTLGIVLWIFLIIQIFAFPMLGAVVERLLWGTTNTQRVLSQGESGAAVQLTGFTKHFVPNWLNRNLRSRLGGKKKDIVVAVEDFNLVVLPGQIMVLLGANGSGKSTTLDAIAGLTTVTRGKVTVNGSQGIGFCPQRNVLFKECTVEENVSIFNRLKSIERVASKVENHELIKACDLDRKIGARVSSLSGGQMRKLQLCLMFTGGSRVCLVDECSSGVDALARRRLQDILLAERSRSNRTIIFTTHFLDEADLLSDHICILSKGMLKAEGTAPEIKNSLGAGYRIHFYHPPGSSPAPQLENTMRQDMYDQTIFTVPDSARAADLLSKLESQGYKNYQIHGPTIEDAFMKISDEMIDTSEVTAQADAAIDTASDVYSTSKEKRPAVTVTENRLQLLTGKHISPFQQGMILFCKRATVFRRNVLPNVATVLLPILATALASLYVRGFQTAGCSPVDQVTASDINSLATQVNYTIVVGPSSSVSSDTIDLLASTLPSTASGDGASSILSSIHEVDTLAEFNSYVSRMYANVTPGGFFLGDDSSSPTFAYKGDGDLSLAVITQNALNVALSNLSIATQYQEFDIPFRADEGNTLQFCIYAGLAFAVYPAFFALYPCIERLRNIRALHYSNGVRSVPLWLAYIAWDFCFVLVGSVICIIILNAANKFWYHLPYLFVVFCCYGLASVLYAYVISLFAKSQLAAFAIAAGTQAVMTLLSLISYLTVLTYAPVDKIDAYLLVVHFTIALVSPLTSLMRALFISLNVFSTACDDKSLASYPGGIKVYGGPILYLLLQAGLLLTILILRDSASMIRNPFRRSRREFKDVEVVDGIGEVAAELSRVNDSADDGLRVVHLSRSFGKNLAVNDISFGVKHGEVFALLGPNGAGKSTTIEMIRGNLRPSNADAKIFINNDSIIDHRAAARQHLGVCPQFDATDQMTVLEHFRFYARIRGVSDVDYNVKEVVRAVGLLPYKTRLAATLSGGNKRKLSLGIALMGNPTVLLLDEPSSGMDVAAKRVMWKTLAGVVADRSIVLTTHSMEEADALADRAGIMASRMLTLGTSDFLRQKHGNFYHVHLLLRSAPHTAADEISAVRNWIADHLPEARVDEKSFHGQIRFSIPATSYLLSASPVGKSAPVMDDNDRISPSPSASSLAAIFSLLESHKHSLGVDFYSVNPTTLEDVFSDIVGRYGGKEEGYGEDKKRRWGLLARWRKREGQRRNQR